MESHDESHPHRIRRRRQGLAEILQSKARQLQQKHGFAPKIVGVITGSKGSLYRQSGLDIEALLAAGQAGNMSAYPEQSGLRRDYDRE